MTDRNPAKLFPKDPNFMTPDILSYGWLPDGHAYELSMGRGFLTIKTLYGVSISGTTTAWRAGQPLDPRSKVFHSKSEALLYINKLRSNPAFKEAD